jgi:hypothetical protein
VPVPRGVHRNVGGEGSFDPTVEHRYHGVALGDGKGAAGAEVRLNVYQQQGVG